MKSKQGITFIELLLVVSIIAILGAAVSPFLTNFILQTNFDTSTSKVISSIRKAQGNSMDKKNGITWGVCKTGQIVRLYSGTCAAPIIKEDFSIPTNVTINNLNDTTFNIRGEPSAAMSVTVLTTIDTTTITVNQAGGIQ